MSPARSVAEQRAYRDGLVDAKLLEHDGHFKAINGSIEETGKQLRSLVGTVAELTRAVTEATRIVPTVEKLEQERRTADQVAATLATKTARDASRWERWRSKISWLAGIATAAVLLIQAFLPHLFF